MFGDVRYLRIKGFQQQILKACSVLQKHEVFAQIETDLTTAITSLPITNVQKGRITKYAAQALLGKVLLYEK
jgi:hypothetical protein